MKPKFLVICLVLLVLFALFALLMIPMLKEYLYPLEYEEYILKYSDEYSVPKPLVCAVIYAESSFDPSAVSGVGAVGLMQLMPDTMDWISRLMGEDNPTGEITDPETNIKYGTYYLSYLYEKFGNWETALAAYNAGHNRVAGWLTDSRYSDNGKTLKNIPIGETYNYVNRITEAEKQYSEIYFNGED